MKKSLIYITSNHTGKMEGLASISTSALDNPNCQARVKNGETICSKCFSMKMHKMYGNNFYNVLHNNSVVLSENIISEKDLPVFNYCFFRFESFGDLINSTQVINYFNICKKNPYTHFALWTKNPWLIEEAINLGYEKPDNLNIILSSLIINQEVTKEVIKYYSFIDKAFTVYGKKEAENVNINCGSRKCMECLRCYKPHTGEVEYINEKIK